MTVRTGHSEHCSLAFSRLDQFVPVIRHNHEQNPHHASVLLLSSSFDDIWVRIIHVDCYCGGNTGQSVWCDLFPFVFAHQLRGQFVFRITVLVRKRTGPPRVSSSVSPEVLDEVMITLMMSQRFHKGHLHLWQLSIRVCEVRGMFERQLLDRKDLKKACVEVHYGKCRVGHIRDEKSGCCFFLNLHYECNIKWSAPLNSREHQQTWKSPSSSTMNISTKCKWSA